MGSATIDFNTVVVSGVHVKKTKERKWIAKYGRLETSVQRSSYTARGFCVMACRDLPTLHAVAKVLGIARGFFDPKNRVYLLSRTKRKSAIKAGVKSGVNSEFQGAL